MRTGLHEPRPVLRTKQRPVSEQWGRSPSSARTVGPQSREQWGRSPSSARTVGPQSREQWGRSPSSARTVGPQSRAASIERRAALRAIRASVLSLQPTFSSAPSPVFSSLSTSFLCPQAPDGRTRYLPRSRGGPHCSARH